MKRARILLAILAIALVLSMSIGTAFAYFTASSGAEGGLSINAKPSTDITETYSNRTKHVVISNAANGEPVYVRVRVFSALPVAVSGTNWPAAADATGWYVYSGIVAPGSATDELTATITFPDDPEEGDNYNVVVVYESTPVQYDASGAALAPDWSLTLDSGTSEGGN